MGVADDRIGAGGDEAALREIKVLSIVPIERRCEFGVVGDGGERGDRGGGGGGGEEQQGQETDYHGIS